LCAGGDTQGSNTRSFPVRIGVAFSIGGVRS